MTLDKLSATCESIEIPSPDQWRRYVPGLVQYFVNDQPVTLMEFAGAAIHAGRQLEQALRDLIVATGRLEAADGSSDALFGVLDMRTRACELLGIEAS